LPGGGIVLVWGVFAAWPFVAPVIDGTRVGEKRRYFRLSRLLLTLFMLAFFGWIIFGLFTPYVRFIDSISGARPR
jgi:hypothetical protein